MGELEEQSVKEAGLVVAARVEHPKHGLGTVQSFQGATHGHPTYADGMPLKVKIAFDNGQTHAYKTLGLSLASIESYHNLRVVQATPDQPPSAAPASATATLTS